MTLFYIWLVSFLGSLIAINLELTLRNVIYCATIGWIVFPLLAVDRIKNIVADKR